MKQKFQTTLPSLLLTGFICAAAILSTAQQQINAQNFSQKHTSLTAMLTPPPNITPKNTPSSITSSPPATSSVPATPASYHLSPSSHVFQTFNNCGPASLSMALSHYDITVSQHTLGSQLRPYQNPQGNNDDKSVTLTELAAKAEEYGLTAYHRPAGTIELVEQLIAQDMPVITRTWLKPGEDIGHFRVITGYNRTANTLIQDDSLQGKQLSYSYEEFERIWRGFNHEFLILVPSDKKSSVESILGPLLNERTAWTAARELAYNQLNQDPQDTYARFNLLVAEYHLGNYQQAASIYKQVAPDLPQRMLWYQIEPILVQYQLGEYDTVLSMTQHVFETQNKAAAELHYLRGLVYQQQGRVAEANESFRLADHYNSSSYWKHNLDTIIQPAKKES